MNKTKMCRDEGLRRTALYVLTAAALSAVTANGQANHDAVPQNPTGKVGESDEALQLLADHIEAMVESGQVVGCEVHVIREGQTVLREAYGWADRQVLGPSGPAVR